MGTRKLLVVGATGNVGGAVADALLGRGHRVRALVRNPAAPGATQLAGRGVELAVGDLDDAESVAEAAKGVDGVFAVTTPMAGLDREIQHGHNVIAAAEEVGVQHLVFSSVASADRETGVPHFDSKAEIEARLSASRLRWTITAPVFFYENLFFPWNAGDLAAGRFRQALPVDYPIQQISVSDVGRFNALVLEQREPFFGERIEIAADELSGGAVADILSNVLGRTVTYEEQSLDEVRDQFADMAEMYDWFRRAGFQVDIPRLRATYPTLPWIRFADWAELHYPSEVEA